MSFNPLDFIKALPAGIITFLRTIIDGFRVKNEKQFTVIIMIIIGLVTLIYQLLYGQLSEAIAINARVTNILEQVGIWLTVLGFLLNVDLPEKSPVIIEPTEEPNTTPELK